MNESFAGYVEINGAQVHVAELRQCTSDIHRFREYLPAAKELNKHQARSEKWLQIIDSVADPSKLLATVKELGGISHALANEMASELQSRTSEA